MNAAHTSEQPESGTTRTDAAVRVALLVGVGVSVAVIGWLIVRHRRSRDFWSPQPSRNSVVQRPTGSTARTGRAVWREGWALRSSEGLLDEEFWNSDPTEILDELARALGWGQSR
jgi:hypothetical protein